MTRTIPQGYIRSRQIAKLVREYNTAEENDDGERQHDMAYALVDFFHGDLEQVHQALKTWREDE